MLSIGFRFVTDEDVYKAIKIWLATLIRLKKDT